MVVAWPEAKADQSTGIGDGLRLPSMIGLITAHGVFARLVPGSGRRSAQVMFANQSQLNFFSAIRIDLLLSARLALSPSQTGLPSLALMRCCRRFAVRPGR